jgi:hypothetical protein
VANPISFGQKCRINSTKQSLLPKAATPDSSAVSCAISVPGSAYVTQVLRASNYDYIHRNPHISHSMPLSTTLGGYVGSTSLFAITPSQFFKAVNNDLWAQSKTAGKHVFELTKSLVENSKKAWQPKKQSLVHPMLINQPVYRAPRLGKPL